MLRFVPTETDQRRLQALAASQKSGVSKRALDQIRAMKTAELQREVDRSLQIRRGW